MKIDIVVVYVPRYKYGHEFDFVPSITGIHLAALTPAQHEVRVVYQQVQAVDLDSDADLICLSFFSGFVDEAYRLADAFKRKGKIVIAGGPHATFWIEETLQHVDAVATGESEAVWPHILADAETGSLKRVYEGAPCGLANLPTPRYDLLPRKFIIRRVIQATRGCPFACSFCSVPSLNPGFRTRPVEDVLRDVAYDDFPRWWQRKVVWFWDDNLTAKRPYIKDLLKKMVPLKRWWLTQASMDIANDPELLDLMAESGCIGVFFGIETFGAASLKSANKPQNQADRYARSIKAMHDRGIAVMAGFVAGFDGDTPESIVAMADELYRIGVDVPFLSILTPYRGTPLYDQLVAEDRLIADVNSSHFNGYNVGFSPIGMSSDDLIHAHRKLWRRAFSPGYAARRILRASTFLRPGALLLTTAMNGFYGYKRLRGNSPRIAT